MASVGSGLSRIKQILHHFAGFAGKSGKGRVTTSLPVDALHYDASPVFAAVFACLKRHFPAAKIFYDLRLDLRFVWYNGCELGEMH